MTQTPQGPAAPASPPSPAAPSALSSIIARGKMWQCLMLVGAVLLFANFFTPWWSMSVKEPDMPKPPKNATPADMEKFMKEAEKVGKELEKSGKDLARIDKENRSWYRDAGVDKKGEAAAEKAKDSETKEFTVRLWGWNVGTALMGFIFSFFIAAFVVVPWFVKAIRAWAWTGALASAIMMIPMIILGLVWLIGSPGENAKPFLTQGIIIGPIICLVAALGTAGASVAEGLGGLLSLFKKKA